MEQLSFKNEAEQSARAESMKKEKREENHDAVVRRKSVRDVQSLLRVEKKI